MILHRTAKSKSGVKPLEVVTHFYELKDTPYSFVSGVKSLQIKVPSLQSLKKLSAMASGAGVEASTLACCS